MRNMMGKLEGLIRQGLVAAVAASIVLGMAQSVQAADVLIVPVAATAESYYAGGTDVRSPEQAINGSGMAPNAPVIKTSTCDNTGFPEWLSNGIRYSWITFDLGSVQTITGFHLWNANQDGDGEIQRGVKTAGIYAGTNLLANGSSYTSAGAAWGTLVENMTFAQGTRSATYAGSDYIFATPVTTRFLQLYVTDNFAGADTYTGISEIRFYSSTPPILSIVANGDFSANAALFTDGASYFGGGNPESAPGWTGGSGIGGTLGSAPDYFGPVNGAIPSYLFMQGVKTVTQTITTTVGKAYLFSFKAACRQNCVVGLTVWADNTQAPNLTIADGGLSVTSFQTYSFVFTGSGVQTLQFVSSGTGDFAADVTDVAVTELDISSSVVNGDFSSNAALFTNGNSYFAAQSTGNPESAPGWTGGSGIGGTLGSAPDYFGPVNGAIPSYLFMQGAKTVTQTILTTVGTTYLLSFKAACRQGNVVGLTVWADNTKLPNLTIPDGGLSGTSFQTYSIMFTGRGV
ncbi:MAG: discoidin domain-containing protein, partial [bacterium]